MKSVADLAVSSMPGMLRIIILVAVGPIVSFRTNGPWGRCLRFRPIWDMYSDRRAVSGQRESAPAQALAALQRVFALYEIVPEDKMDRGLTVERLRGEIELRNVSFSYPDRETVLDNISLCIEPGEHVTIVRPSGVGKTTLLSHLLRFYRLTAGEIYFDGKPASEYEVRSFCGSGSVMYSSTRWF